MWNVLIICYSKFKTFVRFLFINGFVKSKKIIIKKMMQFASICGSRLSLTSPKRIASDRHRHLARVCINSEDRRMECEWQRKRTVDALFTHVLCTSIFYSFYFYATANKKGIWCAYIYFSLLILLGRRRIEKKWRKISGERLVTGYKNSVYHF